MKREDGTMQAASDQTSLQIANAVARKPYSSPRLRVIGRVNVITLYGLPGIDGARRKPQG